MKSWPSHQFLKKKNIHKDYLGRCAVGQPDDACLCLVQEQLELPIWSCMKDLEVLLRTMLQLGFEMGVALTLSHDDFFALSHLLWHSQPASNRPYSVWFEMVVALTLSHGDFQRTFTPACAVTACFTTPMQCVTCLCQHRLQCISQLCAHATGFQQSLRRSAMNLICNFAGRSMKALCLSSLQLMACTMSSSVMTYWLPGLRSVAGPQDSACHALSVLGACSGLPHTVTVPSALQSGTSEPLRMILLMGFKLTEYLIMCRGCQDMWSRCHMHKLGRLKGECFNFVTGLCCCKAARVAAEVSTQHSTALEMLSQQQYCERLILKWCLRQRSFAISPLLIHCSESSIVTLLPEFTKTFASAQL